MVFPKGGYMVIGFQLTTHLRTQPRAHTRSAFSNTFYNYTEVLKN